MQIGARPVTVVLDESVERLLLIWRHRFIVDRWDWEVPGGYVDAGEDGAAAAAREVEEETGWRPRSVEFLLMFQPALGSADAPQDVYVARGADLVGEPEIDEAEAVRWVPVEEALEMIRTGRSSGRRRLSASCMLLRSGCAGTHRITRFKKLRNSAIRTW
jgi:8-oxo-dGTP pyrophosphatase MutT (NUDIX family)